MKTTLIIAHNSLSAGTSSQTLNFAKFLIKNENKNHYFITLPNQEVFNTLQETDNVKFQIIKYNNSLLGLIQRIFFELIHIPKLVKKLKPVSILALSNYFYVPFIKAYKVALLRHPYIVDQKLTQNLDLKEKIIEFFRRQFFKITLYNVHHLIVQSEYMKKRFESNYHFEKEITVLPNPVDVSNFPAVNEIKSNFKEKENILLYPSRYYPHKNFEYIFKLVHENLDFFTSNNIKIYLTLDRQRYDDLSKQFRTPKIDEVIKTLGEIPQKALTKYYLKAKILFFPSLAETFGNALVEGLYFKLPLLLPELPYAVSIAENAGNYFNFDSEQETLDMIKQLNLQEEYWQKYSRLSEQQFDKFLYLDQWTKSIIGLL